MMPRQFARGAASNTNPSPSGVSQGTPGGRAHRPFSFASLPVIGTELYLWVLVVVEVVAMGYLRNHFRRHHGG